MNLALPLGQQQLKSLLPRLLWFLKITSKQKLLSILTSTSTQTHFYEQLLDTYTHKTSIETIDTKFSAQMSQLIEINCLVTDLDFSRHFTVTATTRTLFSKSTMITVTPNSSSLHQSTVYLCGACRHPVEWEQKAVLCEVCDEWFHICCQEIPSTDYSKLDQTDVVWKCTHCNSINQSTF